MDNILRCVLISCFYPAFLVEFSLTFKKEEVKLKTFLLKPMEKNKRKFGRASIPLVSPFLNPIKYIRCIFFHSLVK